MRGADGPNQATCRPFCSVIKLSGSQTLTQTEISHQVMKTFSIRTVRLKFPPFLSGPEASFALSFDLNKGGQEDA